MSIALLRKKVGSHDLIGIRVFISATRFLVLPYKEEYALMETANDPFVAAMRSPDSRKQTGLQLVGAKARTREPVRGKVVMVSRDEVDQYIITLYSEDRRWPAVFYKVYDRHIKGGGPLESFTPSTRAQKEIERADAPPPEEPSPED